MGAALTRDGPARGPRHRHDVSYPASARCRLIRGLLFMITIAEIFLRIHRHSMEETKTRIVIFFIYTKNKVITQVQSFGLSNK